MQKKISVFNHIAISALISSVLLFGCGQSKESKPIGFKKDSVIINKLKLIDTAQDQEKKRVGAWQLLALHPVEKDSASYYWIMSYIADTYYTEPDSMLYYYKTTLPYFETHPEYEEIVIQTYHYIGYAYLDYSTDIYKANYYVSKTASLFLKAKYRDQMKPVWAQRLMINAARTNKACRMNTKALAYSLIADSMTYKTRDSVPMDHVASLSETATLYAILNKPDSGLLYVQQATDFNKTLKQPFFEAGILEAKASCYAAKKMYDSSLHYYQLASWQHRKEMSTGFDDWTNMVIYFTAIRKQEKAAAYLDSIRMTAGLRDSIQQMTATKAELTYTILYGDRLKADSLFRNYIENINTFYDAERYKVQSAIDAEYDLLEKQKNINKLSHEKGIAAEKLAQRNNLLILVSVIALLTAIIFFLLLRQRRLKARQHALENEHKKTELEQRLLRTQMEPHFIFNTLAVLQGMVRSGDVQKTSKYLNSFGRLLRISLENSRESLVPVHKEIEALEDYIGLQAMRFEDSIEYTISIYNGYENDVALIPPMLLQPFAENAIQHGMRPGPNKLSIKISIERNDNSLLYRIEDNGKGYTGDKNGNGSKRSLSIQITKERLDAISKKTGIVSDLQISNTGNGTLVKMIIPIVSE